MSPWQALIETGPPAQRKDWPEPVRRNGRDLNLNVAPKHAPTLHADPVISPFEMAPPMSELCKCGLRYGQHRVKDFACQNQKWRPGNGQPQWLSDCFRRAKWTSN